MEFLELLICHSNCDVLAVLSAAAVGSTLLAAILDVCREWTESLPQLTQVPGNIELSVHAIKNTRRKMEDRHAVCVDINSLFGLKVGSLVSEAEPEVCVLCAFCLTGLPPSVLLCCV